MKTLAQVNQDMTANPKNGLIELMDFVDDFRYYKDCSSLQTPFPLTDERLDALLASTAEALCAELGFEPPEWIQQVPACQKPWFVAGMENLKAIALVESPLYFRIRKIFVLENFLHRA